MLEALEFLLILFLTMVLVFLVFWQEYFLVVIKSAYDKTLIAVSCMLIRLGLSIWIIYSMTATLLGTLQIVLIQLIVLLCLWLLSKYVRKYGERFYITITAFMVYSIGFYYYIMYAKTFL
ncbi:hypothetical protein [Bacillus cereus]|uniref:hypothetical protein n=2 Tax=Bacillus TaxID=1386 RepID=UPI002A05BD03|nr:hypothetical protein [Bacillus cereus]BCC04751.1 hypothetical protein BCM0060_1014 [Bacillus cereus]